MSPNSDGVMTGSPTYRQNVKELAPRFDAASRHSVRSPSMTGTIEQDHERELEVGVHDRHAEQALEAEGGIDMSAEVLERSEVTTPSEPSVAP